jgi:hypothetical protein
MEKIIYCVDDEFRNLIRMAIKLFLVVKLYKKQGLESK